MSFERLGSNIQYMRIASEERPGNDDEVGTSHQVGTRDILPTGNIIMMVNAREIRDVPENELLDVINGLVS